MVARKTLALMLTAFLLMSATHALAEHAPGERHIYRALLTTAGGIGGVVAGGYIGFNAGSNDYRNSAIGAVVGLSCGIVGGYLLGRKIDKSRIPKAKPDAQKVTEAQKRVVDMLIREYAARFPQPVPAQTAGK